MLSISQLVARGAVLVGVTVILNGCVAPRQAQMGIVENADVRETSTNIHGIAPDFIYRSETGERVKFSESRGDVTILVFPPNEGWPDCGRCCQLQELSYRLKGVYSDVTVVSIFSPEDSCEHPLDQLRNCEIQGYADLITLCDPDGYVRDLYGPQAKGRFFIIDARGRQAGTGELADLNSIEHCVRQAVYQHEAYCNRFYGPQEIDWPY